MKTISILTLLLVILAGFSLQQQDKHSDIEYGEFTDQRDNRTYKTVKIGDQVWLAENFAYVPYVCQPDSFDCGVWVYNYDGNDVSAAKETPEYQKYGALYSWSAARDLAPEGWHLPSDEEWKELEEHIGIDPLDIENKEWRGDNNEANKLKVDGETGLDVLFGGWMTDYGKFNFINEHANFWCSTEFDQERGYERLVGVNNGKIGRAAGNKGCGFSVRYIKD
jgi:uncharacterized protein (TIGR02145 family)